MRLLAALSLAVLILPGSGRLWIDGLPLGRPIELFATVVMLVLVLSRAGRERLKGAFAKRQPVLSAIRWVLGGLCVAKVLTFFWMPFGNGFEACYRSIFNPIAPYVCEKSYESWWGTPWSTLGTANISRVEREIDFGPTGEWPSVRGASDSTWDLPFTNDYPRLGDLWLDRIPFTAVFVGTLDITEPGFLPVHGTGDFSVTIASQSKTSDPVTAYYHDQTLVIPVSPGRSEIRIEYQHADTLEATIPDSAPPSKGLAAQLFVGRSLTERELKRVVDVRVRLVVIDTERRTTPNQVLIRSADGAINVPAVRIDRPDVAEVFGEPKFTSSGFDFGMRLRDLAQPTTSLEIIAVSNGVASRIGRLSVDLSPATGLDVRVSPVESRWLTPQLSSWLVTNTDRVEPLRPLGTLPLFSSLFSLLTAIVNLLSLALILISVILVLRDQTGALFQGLASLVIAALAARLLWDARLSFAPSAPTLWLVGVAVVLLVLFRSRITRASILAISLFASVRVITLMTQTFNSIPADAWWGRIIFMSRDSDWFVGQGYARQILNEGSLRAGESVFYFQPGVRYVIFFLHLLLGENDVLISILALAALLFVVCEVGRISANSVANRLGKAACLMAVLLVLHAAMSQQLATFAIAVASEYPTWILLAVSILCIHHAISARSATAVVVSAAIAGLIPNFRPNQIGGSILLLGLASFTMWRVVEQRIALRIGGILKVFMIFTSTALLSLAHNLHYGGTFLLYSSTGTLNSDFTWSSLFDSTSASESLQILWKKFQFGMYWTSWPSLNELSLSFWGVQAFWIVSLSWMIVRRQLNSLAALTMLLPFALLVPLLPYRFDSYYPRHIVVIQFAFALGALAALRLSSSSRISDQSALRASNA